MLAKLLLCNDFFPFYAEMRALHKKKILGNL